MKTATGEPSPLEIRVENLHKSFGSNEVLRGVDLSVPRGEMIAIVGGSGSGKTVLMQHLICHLRPDQGSVWLADHESPGSSLVDLSKLDEAGMDQLRIHWAVVFQGNGLLSGTVEYNLSLPLEWVKGLDKDQIRVRRSSQRSDQMVWRRRVAKTTAVNGVGLVAYFGEMLFIVGPSGSGKTTMLSMISGILRPNAGKVIRQRGRYLDSEQ
jgi:ABC-type transporter Mla maintaining outer membrane lipid asymmetry ATPase subunit MlaF